MFFLTRTLTDGSVVVGGVRWVRFTQRHDDGGNGCVRCCCKILGGRSYFKPTHRGDLTLMWYRLCVPCVVEIDAEAQKLLGPHSLTQ